MNIELKDGVFAKIKSVKIVFDLVDESGKAISEQDFVQSENSFAEASGGELDEIEISPSLLRKSVFGSDE